MEKPENEEKPETPPEKSLGEIISIYAAFFAVALIGASFIWNLMAALTPPE